MHLVGFLLIVTAACAFAQQYAPTSATPQSIAGVALPDAPSHIVRQASAGASAQQSEPIFDLKSNSGAVSAGAASLSPTFRQSLNLTSTSSSLIVGGSASGVSESSGAQPQLNGGGSGSEKNCAHTRADKAKGGTGSRRWSLSPPIRAVVTVPLAREASGNAAPTPRHARSSRTATIAPTGSMCTQFPGAYADPAFLAGYYPYDSGDRLAARYASAIGRDAVRNMFSEFWPDFATHVLRRRP